MKIILRPGIAAALGSALLFGASTPLAKLLLGRIDPWLLAGLLYLGSGVGLALYRRVTRAKRVHLPRAEAGWLAGAIMSGGVIAPVLLMLGLSRSTASGGSLMLNAEGVLTALLAWFAFKENFDRRIALGMCAIAAGAIVLGWPRDARFDGTWPALAILGACLGWAIDNNLTRKVSLSDATWIAAVKGLVAGTVNLALAYAVGARFPGPVTILVSMSLGLFAYGISLTLFVVALRHLGTARAGAYFSVAPFFGAALAVALGESMTTQLALAAGLMGVGVWLHLTERHEHLHVHMPMEHDHEHAHDEHHQHSHDSDIPAPAPGSRHTHRHRHERLDHAHPHFPDAHHRHEH